MDTVSCIQRAVDFIEENILSELNAEIIASQAYMSSFYFQRVFSIVCGISVGEYIRNRRLTLAGMEVKASDEKIINIALKYNYDTPESFSRAFTRFHGMSPMAARSQFGEIHSFAKISVQSILGGKQVMEALKQRGYAIRENGPVYYTKDMDNTARWFEDVLGWYAEIDQRDENGAGTYGCVFWVPNEVSSMTCMPFNGFHLFFGEPAKQTVAFMRVDNIKNLHSFVKSNGWEQITDIETQHWGGEECEVTTVDGGIMRFFQLA